jgi:hypothetical protein
MLNVSRLIKGSITALAVVATAMAVVSNEQAPYAATAPELTNSTLQSTANRFRLEFATPSESIRAWWPASTQSFTLAKGDRLPMTKAVRHDSRQLIDGGYPFAANGWQRSVATAAPATTRTMPLTD